MIKFRILNPSCHETFEDSDDEFELDNDWDNWDLEHQCEKYLEYENGRGDFLADIDLQVKDMTTGNIYKVNVYTEPSVEYNATIQKG